MYGARSGKVVRRVSSLASPRLASKTVVGAAGKTEVFVPRCRHAVDVDHSRSGIAGVICGHSVGGAIAISCWLAGDDVDGVGDIYWHASPFFV